MEELANRVKNASASIARSRETLRLRAAGRPGYEIFKSRGLFAVRCRPPNGLNRIYRASGLAFWRYGNPRFDARLSETRWDGDTSYPHSTGCCGTSSRFFPSTASADALSRASLNSSTGSSEPPKCNACWPARKPSRPLGVRQPLSDFTVADRPKPASLDRG
jgi:hypothetical protein